MLVQPTINYFSMGGDCSEVRRAVLPMRGARHCAVGVGWPAGFSGTLSLEGNTSGLAVASTPLGITIGKQPTGSADGTVITGIETDLPYIILVYTPISDGAGVELLNENQDVGSKPTLSLTE